MVEWRGEASARFPELRDYLERDSWSCHVFLFEVLQLAVDAHRAADEDLLNRSYGFAQWCFDQPGGFLSNAAVVSFYEHVFDAWELRHEVADRLSPAVTAKVRPLWEWRLPADRLAEVDRLLGVAGHPA
ncbi:hypothetical protein GCM10010174_31900 [Kutzneria viridogrisea]|uniref:DUF7674 domain-containing protein n=2 Tax=Kutzneria TaxID=43356 RepID=W5VYE6_9PSEU|nr:hypothetical protein [Kutzneria albida]AHH93465.1 hypothetical protein KALB_88 [Kutzneria albida DSM 43870]MBA8929149.1 hypothetical protein [Kutzneria viridogrisea]